jgi:preprotein translocase subunit SecA
MSLLNKLFKPKSERDFKRIKPTVDEVNRWADEFASLSDDQFSEKTREFKGRLQNGESVDDLLPEAFGLVKAVCKALVGRTWDVVGIPVTWEMVPYDVQIAGAVNLHRGSIAEMATGEGKTLVATMPMYLNALEGKGAHLVTVNDYLARRDAEWMGKVYELLGLSVGCIQTDIDNESRISAYNADITYGTNNEFGFDYLRDNMKTRLVDKVQRAHRYAIVDEVDSVLIDEARTPLIISGPVSHGQSSDLFRALKPKVERVVRMQQQEVNRLVAEAEKGLNDEDRRDEVGRALLKVKRGGPRNNRFMKLMTEPGIEKMIQRCEADLMRMKVLSDLDEELYYAVDEKANTINLTDKGRDALSPEDREQFILPDLSEMIGEVDANERLTPAEKVKAKDRAHRKFAERSDSIHNFNQLLKAYTLFEKDVEYVVQDGRVIIVDEFTGRLMPGRRFSEGLHQALEAKEGVRIEAETQTLATITLQNYFRMYDKLAGMTGTAETEAEEFNKIYKLDVGVVPTNEPVRRVDYEDQIYRTKREKYNAIVDEIARLHEKRLPVLVGTVSVEVSETLSRLLKRRGIKHNVLNAKYHQKEAEIVAYAGRSDAVTIATNMAGRGTDIKLEDTVVRCDTCGIGTGRSDWPTKDGETVDTNDCESDVPCGLHIVGTERHESRRIDRQLRGRSGRQGDPGSSVFYLSLEDDLMRLFRPERIAGVMDRLGVQEGEVITHSLVTKSIERSQRRVEAYNFEIRKRLIEYDDVMNKQREVIYGRRDEVMEAENLDPILELMVEDTVDAAIDQFIDPSELPEHWPVDELLSQLEGTFLYAFGPVPVENIEDLTVGDVRDHARGGALKALELRQEFLARELGGQDHVREFTKYVLLQNIDEKWMDHLHELDSLKEGIHYRAYAQKNPLVEYKQEAFGLFAELNDRIDREALYIFFHARISAPRESRADLRQARTVHHDASAFTGAAPEQASPEAAVPAQSGMGATTATSAALKQRQATAPVVRTENKVGRNDPCPCGSGKKYKKCCGKAG